MIDVGPPRPEDRDATKQDNTTARALYDKVARYQAFIRYDYPLA